MLDNECLYLSINRYSETAEVFSKSVGHVFEEELASIRHRQKIQGLVLSGHLSEAITLTHKLFPNILERNPNLLFALKIREFIEMISSVNRVGRSKDTSVETRHLAEEKVAPMSVHLSMAVDNPVAADNRTFNNNGYVTYKNNGSTNEEAMGK
jgi:hypothetical protein